MNSCRGVLANVCFLVWTLPWRTLAVHTQPRYQSHKQSLHHWEAQRDPRLRVVGGPNVSDVLACKLWDGVDLAEEDYARFRPAAQEARGGAAATSVAPHQEGEIRILGPFDSGTNLLSLTLLRNHWPLVADIAVQGALRPLAVWKHSQSSASDLCQRLRASAASDNLTVLVMVRSPISQLVSWHTRPYDLAPCMKQGYEDMGRPCFANTRPDWNYAELARAHSVAWGAKIWERTPGCTLEFENSMGVYNHYLRQYRHMLTEPACRKINVLLVRYEDLVFTPQKVMQQLAQQLGWPIPSDLTVVDSSSKGNDGVGRSAAMKKIESRVYTSELTLAARAARCKELDVGLVGDLFEKSFTEAPVSYVEDCQGLQL